MSGSFEIQYVPPDEPLSFQASQWQKYYVLIDGEELAHLLKELSKAELFTLGSIFPIEELHIDKVSFIERYKEAMVDLETPSTFCLSATLDSHALRCKQFKGGRGMIQVCTPVLQLQSHSFSVSHEQHRLFPMVFGEETIPWGLQFSFPQLYQDPVSGQVVKVLHSNATSNTELFKTLRKWIRHYTSLVTFCGNGEEYRSPLRLGKKCFSWINQHPSLKKHQLEVVGG